MNAQALQLRPTTRRYAPTTYEAFRLDNGKASPLSVDAASLAEAVAGAQQRCLHKEHLLIKATDEDGRVSLHIYVIKRKAPKWVHPAGEIVPRRVQDLYAAPVCVVPGEALAEMGERK